MTSKVIDHLGTSIYNIMRRLRPDRLILNEIILQSQHLPAFFAWIPLAFNGEIAFYVRQITNQATTISNFVRLDSVSAHGSTAKALIVIDLSVSVYHHPIADHQQIDDRVYTSAYAKIISQLTFEDVLSDKPDHKVTIY